MRIYIGTYTKDKERAGGEPQGIHCFDYDASSGGLTKSNVTEGVISPTFLCLSPGRDVLYAASEIDDFEGRRVGAISAYRVDMASGRTTLLNQKSSHGAASCYVSTTPDGKYLMTANYDGRNVAVFELHGDGSLGESTSTEFEGSGADPERQSEPHPHFISLGPSGGWVYVCDLGSDKIWQCTLSQGRLTPLATPALRVHPGAGPRHLVFHPNSRFVYVVNELDATVSSCRFDPLTGEFRSFQTESALPEDFNGQKWAADIHVHPNGRVLYSSNRGHDSIAIFRVDRLDGKLTPAGHVSSGGETPRNFAISPDGRFLLVANQDSENLVLFRTDPDDGSLAPTGQVTRCPRPVCVQFAD
ncbi:MAG TPA: lactonase family protein [Polyangiaceae bacterium]|jgi:6-phosphogluconolactonase